MKIYKKIVLLLAVALILVCTAMPAFAAETINPDRSISLTLTYHDDDTPLVGAEFSIYQVAKLDKHGRLSTTEEFSRYNVNIVDSDRQSWKTLASTLEGYVLRDKLLPTDSKKTNEQGVAFFPNKGVKLTPGLYLVLGTSHVQNEIVYETLPFMISMPMQYQDEDEWNYDLSITPKYATRSEHETGTVNCKVLKIWKDDGNELNRPKEVVIQLLRDGEIYDTVKLNEENNWRYKWNNLNIEYQWRVVEKELDNYMVEVLREGTAFVITNTYVAPKDDPTEPVTPSNPSESVVPSNPSGTVTPSNPSESTASSNPSGSFTPSAPNGSGTTPNKPNNTPNDTTLPQTGQLWWPVPLLSAVGLIMILIGLLLFRGNGNEEN